MADMGQEQSACQLASDSGLTAAGEPPRVVRRGRRIIRAVIYLTIAYVVWCAAMYFFQDKLVFPRDLAPSPTPQRGVESRNVLTITTESGRPIEGWFIPAQSVHGGRPAPAVIFFHGNGEIIDYQDRVPLMWNRMDVSVLMPEYRGYGRARSAGKPSEEALVADGVRFYDELIRRPDVDRSRIVIQGHSLGGAVAAQVAARRPPAALILESTFTSIADFAWRYGVPPFLTHHPFHTDEILPGIGVPVFIGHGRADAIVPVSHGRKLHALAPSSVYVELDCGHLDMPGALANDAYRERIREFLVSNGVLATRPSSN